ncbi:MAG: hypothetical protein K2P74_06145 [Nitrosomonas sp.]|nr:hypothetical protein [Nitrosomonas sp.]
MRIEKNAADTKNISLTNEHFESVINAVAALRIVFQQPDKDSPLPISNITSERPLRTSPNRYIQPGNSRKN